MLKQLEIILDVNDQTKSAEFYSALLAVNPVLDVPGMTEFAMGNGVRLGLMPNSGIAKIISPPLHHLSSGHGIPRAELYLLVDDPDAWIARADEAGAIVVSPFAPRDWGDSVAYYADPDGHVIAIAERIAFSSQHNPG